MNRKETITSLLEFDSDLGALRDRLSKIEWDSDEQVQCSPRHVRSVLEQYLAGRRSAEDVEAWANLVEGRDDIDLASALREVIFELANPSITQKLSAERARVVVNGLGE